MIGTSNDERDVVELNDGQTRIAIARHFAIASSLARVDGELGPDRMADVGGPPAFARLRALNHTTAPTAAAA